MARRSVPLRTAMAPMCATNPCRSTVDRARWGRRTMAALGPPEEGGADRLGTSSAFTDVQTMCQPSGSTAAAMAAW